MSVQSVDLDRQSECVVNRDVDLRPLRNSDERSRTLGRPSFLPEGVGISILPLFVFRVLVALTYFEFQLQHPVLELSGRRTVVIRDYQWQ